MEKRRGEDFGRATRFKVGIKVKKEKLHGARDKDLLVELNCERSQKERWGGWWW